MQNGSNECVCVTIRGACKHSLTFLMPWQSLQIKWLLKGFIRGLLFWGTFVLSSLNISCLEVRSGSEVTIILALLGSPD